MEVDGLVEGDSYARSDLHVVGSEPAADAGLLEVVVEFACDVVVFAGVGDKAGVELDGAG